MNVWCRHLNDCIVLQDLVQTHVDQVRLASSLSYANAGMRRRFPAYKHCNMPKLGSTAQTVPTFESEVRRGM